MHLHQFSSSSFNISGAAGLITSINRIITKLVLHNEKTNTLIFFVLSAAIVLVCLLTHHLARKSDFIRYYTAACNAASTAEDQQHLTLNDQVRRLHHWPLPTRLSGAVHHTDFLPQYFSYFYEGWSKSCTSYDMSDCTRISKQILYSFRCTKPSFTSDVTYKILIKVSMYKFTCV